MPEKKRPWCFSIPYFLLVFLVIFQATHTYAAILEIQPLHFGQWLISDNSAAHHITLAPDGSYTNSSELFMLDLPQVGIYQVTDLPPFATILSVDVVQTVPMTSGAGEEFTMDNFQVIAPNADGAGMTTLTLGARARTSGNGAAYPDATYNGTLEITINL